MIQVRNNIFETNSSSTHCIVITTNEEWENFKNGELVLDMYNGELTPITKSMKIPRQLENGKWEFEGSTYDSIFDICTSNYSWYDRDKMLYEAFQEDSHEVIRKKIDEDRFALSIYGYDY